jgi:hypothetical protein
MLGTEYIIFFIKDQQDVSSGTFFYKKKSTGFPKIHINVILTSIELSERKPQHTTCHIQVLYCQLKLLQIKNSPETQILKI